MLSFRVKKGDAVFIPLVAVNRSKRVWGEDAADFKFVMDPTVVRPLTKYFYRPDRWLKDLPQELGSVPGKISRWRFWLVILTTIIYQAFGAIN